MLPIVQLKSAKVQSLPAPGLGKNGNVLQSHPKLSLMLWFQGIYLITQD